MYSSSDFDSQVHEELKRARRVIFRGLYDYYYFGNTLGRDLQDIVYEDILNEKESDPAQIEKLAIYID